MNYPLVARMLGVVAALIGVAMVFSLPWALPTLGHRTGEPINTLHTEVRGSLAILASMVISFAVAAALYRYGRRAGGVIYRKEAMAVVGLSWAMATALGAFPYLLAGVKCRPAIRVFGGEHEVQIDGYNVGALTAEEHAALAALAQARARGLSESVLMEKTDSDIAGQTLAELAKRNDRWTDALILPGEEGPADRRDRYRIRWRRMNVFDALFEAQSGFSTTGATVLSDLEDPYLVPHSLLFWRSMTHFLGGLGIIVLFVAVLGQGSAGKALMRTEMPGPTKEGSTARMQHTAWAFASIYVALNGLLVVLLMICGMSLFDAACHAFGTMATGGFSTFNASVGAFNSSAIDYVITVFMVLAGTNFALLYAITVFKPMAMVRDAEWRTYIGILLAAAAAVIGFGLAYGDFTDPLSALRYGLFQVVSIMTTTGYGTHDFDAWNSFAKGLLFLLMFVGGCAGSTGGGLKVIRHVLMTKILGQELERSYHPRVVRPLRVGATTVEDADLKTNILVYFSLISLIFGLSWLFVLTFEPDLTWGSGPEHAEHKLVDSASAVAATLNNIGPGLGIVGATQNYTNFSWSSKSLFVVLMMIGRVEIFAILVLFLPGFWRAR